jgi:hypothetical protein
MTGQINPTAAPAKPRRGCFFYGCMTGLVLLGLVGLVLIACGYYFNTLVKKYTDSRPMKMPTVSMSKDDVDRLKQRFDAFQQSVRDQKPTAPLVLTSDDINALIANNGDTGTMSRKLYISLDGDKVKGDLSLPLQSISTLFFKGRYLNGSAIFNVSLHDGSPFFALDSVTVKGQPLPDAYLQGFRNLNFAAGWTNDPNTTSVLNQLQDIEVKDSKMTIMPKSVQGAPESVPKGNSSLSSPSIGAQEALVFEHRITVGHAGQIIADRARPALAARPFTGMAANVRVMF